MAQYCVSIFGDMLLDKPIDDFPVSSDDYINAFYYSIKFSGSNVLMPCFIDRRRQTTTKSESFDEKNYYKE